MNFILSTIVFLGCIFPPLPAKMQGVSEPTLVSVKNEDFNKSLYGFASRILGIEPGNFSVQEYRADSDMAETGQESHIYFILNENHQALGVIKMIDYTNNAKTFDREKKMLQQFERLSLKKFQTPRLLGDAIISDGNLKQGLLLESIASGKSLNNLLREYSQTTNPKEKVLLGKKLKLGFEQAGSALGEMHKASLKATLSNAYKDRFKKTDEELGTSIVKELPGPFGMIHGDAHLGNIFYDAKTNKATFIDLPTSEASLDGAPIGYDLAEFLLTFEILGSYYGLSENELFFLSDAFLNSYRKSGPDVSDETIHTYYTYLLAEYGLDRSPCIGAEKDQCQFFASYTAKKFGELRKQFS